MEKFNILWKITEDITWVDEYLMIYDNKGTKDLKKRLAKLFRLLTNLRIDIKPEGYTHE